MDRALAMTGGLPSPTTAYRGLRFESDAYLQEFLSSAQPGTVLADDAYFSSSLSPNVAGQFALGEPGDVLGRGVIVQVLAPTGLPYAAGSEFEAELIFQRGLQVQVVTVDTVTVPTDLGGRPVSRVVAKVVP
jgi:hypothetical protein